MDTDNTATFSPLANLVRVVLPVAAAIGLPPLLLGWALVQAAAYLN